ncbi:MAG: hypothetical protein GDA46_01380 [Bdellovibrionales bacterium]|nr:hypothetical protein [Bdellovibrionales bacterium]
MSFPKEVSFKEYLCQELSTYHIPLTLKNYLIELLSFYLRSEHFFQKKQGTRKYHEKNLTEIYMKIQNTKNTQEKIYLLKTIGDFSLCLSGFFRESIKRQILNVSYYEEIGQSSYYLVSKNHDKNSSLFKGLAKNFKFLSKVLFTFQKQTHSLQKSPYLLNFTKKPNLSKKIK